MPYVSCKLGVFEDDKTPEPLKALLKQVFYDHERVIVDRVFTSGHSGATTFLVNFMPKEPPLVVKFLSASKWQQELNAYKRHIEGEKTPRFSQFTASILSQRCCLSDDGRWGLLVYTVVGQGALESADSLYDFFMKNGGAQTGTLLENLFSRDGELWWGYNRTEDLYVSKEYDQLLPVHLELRHLETAPEDVQDLTAGVSAARLATLLPGAKVIVNGFTVDEVKNHTVSLRAQPGDAEAGPVRLRFNGVTDITHFREGQPVWQQSAEVIKTRLSTLADTAKLLVAPHVDPLRDEVMPIAGFELRNPLLALDALLGESYPARFSLIHGDLNLENMRVPAGSNHGWLIDFAQSRRGPALFDLQRLEAGIVNHLLAPMIEREPDLEVSDALSLLRSLHAAEHPEYAPVEALQHVYDLFKVVRMLVAHYLVTSKTWREYYNGLILALLGSLKFSNLSDTTKSLTFAAAASAMTLKDTPIVSQVSDTQLPGGGPAPYKGLAVFEEEDAAVFFGRNELVQELVESIRDLPKGRPHPLHFMAIIGYSGCGKSSLLRAGLIPKLKTAPDSLYRFLPQSVFRPLGNPLHQLAAFVCQEDEPEAVERLVEEMRAAYQTNQHEAVQALDRYIVNSGLDGKGRRLFLPIDQFEELYTASDEEIQAFVNNLLFAASPQGHAAVVIACRSDFYTPLIQTPHLARALEDRTKNLYPMDESHLQNLAAMILGPAQRSGMSLQAGLQQLLLNDLSVAMRSDKWIRSTPAVLPLLSEVLRQTWEQRKGITLTLNGYYATGGIQGVIARMADRVYDRLNEEEQKIARRVLVQLANPGEAEGMGTKRRLDLAELAYGEERTQLEDVINKLVRGRLLVSGLRSSTHINGIEIVHEALIREWPQLRQWLEDVRDERRIHDRLAADAQSWEDSNREDNSLLYEGNTRERTVHWARRNAHSIDAPMSDFLLASFVHELIRNSNPTEVSKLLDSWSDHVEQDLLRLVLQQEAVNLRRKIRERHNAGIALALIGEQRPGIGVIGGLPDIEWCSVPEGQFIMGEGAEEHIVWIDSFAIAKYPITVAQFHAYVSAVKPYAAIRDAANLSRRPANHPVEVTWYDALGFCMWLSKELSRRHGTDIQVYLPTEAQWEKAARGGLQIPICPSKPDAGLFANPLPNRPYAWVDTLVDFDETQIPYYCNVYETDLRDTSSVGIFPNGASCYGCLDMAGNVLEWTSSKYQPYPYTADDGREVLDDSGDQRTLRGGSYAYFSSYSLCTARGRGNVADPDGDGFRIVCSSPNFWVL